MERLYVRFHAKYLPACGIEENQARRVSDGQRPGPRFRGKGFSLRGHYPCRAEQLQLGDVESREQRAHRGIAKTARMQLVASGAMFLLEQYGERFSLRAPQAGEVVGRLDEEGLFVQRTARGLARVALKVRGKASLLLLFTGNIIESGLKFVRRIVTVEAQDHCAFFIEEEHSRRELHFQKSGEILLAPAPAIDPHHFAVAPDIDRNGVEMPPGLVGDLLLAEVDAHELAAVRASILPEVHEQALAPGGSVRHVFPEVEKRLLEPRRV